MCKSCGGIVEYFSYEFDQVLNEKDYEKLEDLIKKIRPKLITIVHVIKIFNIV
jgi:glycine/serine hydroxymethyltransferase